MSALLAPPAPPAAATADPLEAPQRAGAVELRDPLLVRCVEVSRRLGRRGLALCGGGNASVKSALPAADGTAVETLWVKASGRDLARIDEDGFSPLDLVTLRRLLHTAALPDAVMARELRRALLDPAAPPPSIETLSHAALPHRFVLHAHPDALLAFTACPSGARRARRLLGPRYLVLPWVAPGFALGRAVAELWQREGNARTRGIVLLHHGVFTFADEAEEAWESLVDCERRAAAALPRGETPGETLERGTWSELDVATLRQELSHLAERPLLLAWDDSPAARRFAARRDVAALVRRGPLTPDHVLRTKRHAVVVPGPGRIRAALTRFALDYRAYFRRCAAGRPLVTRDPAPRVVVAPGAGIFAAGSTAAEAEAALEVYRHTVEALLAAEGLGGHRPLPARQLFDVEYGAESNSRLGSGDWRSLAGRVALVAGAAGAVGRAVVEELIAAGAVVAGLDVVATPAREGYLSIVCDTRDDSTVAAAVAAAVRRFGGLDLLISDVGVAPPARTLDELTVAEWRQVMELNATAHLTLLHAAIPLLERAAAPAAVVLMGARHVLAPGPAAAAYSASKAALTQLGRVAAIELASRGIRVNTLHPDGDPGTALATRAPGQGEAPQRRNLLHTEVRARHVARLAVALCTDLFACTTGAQIPVDGGDARSV